MDKDDMIVSNQGLNQSLLRTISGNELKEIAADNAEVALDFFLKDGLLKEIPIFGSLYKTYKAGIGIRDALFAKKIYKFLKELRDIPQEKRVEFVEQIETDTKFSHKVGEKLIMITDQMDDMDKPSIIGRLFAATINKNIDYETFLRLSSIIVKAFLPDIIQLEKADNHHALIYIEGRLSKIQKEHFVSLGIMSTELKQDMRNQVLQQYIGQEQKDNLPPVVEYKVNNLGTLLIKYGLITGECTLRPDF